MATTALALMLCLNPPAVAATKLCASQASDERLAEALSKGPATERKSLAYVQSVQDPHAGLTITISGNDLLVKDAAGNISRIFGPNSGDDYHGLESIKPLASGWFYLDGAQYDNAFQLEMSNGQWQIKNDISIREYQGMLDSLARWLLGMDTGPNIVRKGQSRVYSQSLAMMLFLNEGEALVDGRFVSFGRGYVSYPGDLMAPRVAILSGLSGYLYSFDGKTVEQVSDTAIGRGRVFLPLGSSRSFFANWSMLYEFHGSQQGGLSLARIGHFPVEPNKWYRIVALRDGTVVLVAAKGVYRVEGDDLLPAWSPQDGAIVEPQHDRLRTQDGIGFVVEDRAGRHGWLLTSCARP
jgi:hypothetical protein